jgi:hypothetical protein
VVKTFSSYATGLTSVTIGDGVTSIGNYAFDGCGALTSVTIPGSVTSIGDFAFNGCSGLTAFTVAESNTVYSAQDGILYNKAKTTIISVPRAISGALTLPNTLTSIGASAFSGCSGLTSVTIPGSVTSIGDYAFSDCRGLTSVTIPGDVTSIGASAFFGCSGLTSVTIPGSVTSIGASAFSGCSGLTSVTIPGSVTSIGASAFSDCSGLTAITVAESNTVYSAQDGILYDKAQTTIISVPRAISGALTLPNTLTSIGASAFFGCSGLTSVTIPGSVTSIGEQAFFGCSGLTSVIFGAGSNITTAWDNNAFGYYVYPTNYYTGNSLWNAYRTGSKPGTYTRSGTTWTRTQ